MSPKTEVPKPIPFSEIPSQSGESLDLQKLTVILQVYDPQASNIDYLNTERTFLTLG